MSADLLTMARDQTRPARDRLAALQQRLRARYTVTKLREADFPEIATFVPGLLREVIPEAAPNLKKLEGYLRFVLSSDATAIFVCRDRSGVIVSLGTFYVSTHLTSGRLCLYDINVFTDPARRGGGSIALVLDAAEDWAAGIGCELSCLMAVTGDPERRIEALYASLGYAVIGEILKKTVHGDPNAAVRNDIATLRVGTSEFAAVIGMTERMHASSWYAAFPFRRDMAENLYRLYLPAAPGAFLAVGDTLQDFVSACRVNYFLSEQLFCTALGCHFSDAGGRDAQQVLARLENWCAQEDIREVFFYDFAPGTDHSVSPALVGAGYRRAGPICIKDLRLKAHNATD